MTGRGFPAWLDHVDLTGAGVTADAARASRETAEYIAGQRGADYLLTVKGNTPGPSAATAPESSTSTLYRRRPIRL